MNVPASSTRGSEARALRLRLRHWVRVLEAGAELTRASIALRAGGSARKGRLLGRLATDVEGAAEDARQLQEAQRVGFAVSRAARWLPWHPTCLRQAIAAQRMLRRRGISSRLQLGVRKATLDEAHAWVTVRGRPVIGQRELEAFETLAGFE
jgi:Transglutaminase-like superfamily